ncbi:hypothetical protein M1P56_05210 [Streptomyces sp. HU2014]|uniref:hypothetical protein n=1 Tax=Streptomyces TaxID=1883 RepID=UPI001F2F39D4|nr:MULTISPECIES: hypothetical protein [Streptomyces]UQI43796.1 hypothetical protein M1P56_05210 [Streptomyces sp. HU2014]
MGRRQHLRVRTHGRAADGRPGAPPTAGRVLARNREWRAEARAAWLCGLGLTGVLVSIDLARGTLDGWRGGFWTGLGALFLAVLLPQRVTAGDGWLATRGLLRERRVRTDLLTRVRRSEGITPRLVLCDVGGGRVELDPQVLIANPLLWHQLDAGARCARRSGLLREGAPVLASVGSQVDGDIARELLGRAGLE